MFLVWGDVRTERARICVADTAGQEVAQFSVAESPARPLFIDVSPKGDHCLFSTKDPTVRHDAATVAYRLYALSFQTGESFQLGHQWMASWSPDGCWIAAAESDYEFVLIAWPSRRVELTLRANASPLESSTNIVTSYGTKPMWSPDSRYVVFNLCCSSPPPCSCDVACSSASEDTAVPRDLLTPTSLVLDLTRKAVCALSVPTAKCAWRP